MYSQTSAGKIVAYQHPTTPPVSAPLRSRLSSPPSHRGKATERPGLLEMLRGMQYESSIHAEQHALRVGIACSAWQYRAASLLFRREGKPDLIPLLNFGPDQSDPDTAGMLALALDSRLASNGECAVAAAWVRVETLEDASEMSLRYPDVFATMHAEQRKPAVIESYAVDSQAPVIALLQLLTSLLGQVTRSHWDATDLVIECPREQAAWLSRCLGFTRLAGLHHSRQTLLRLDLRPQEDAAADASLMMA